jgi:hypothetical protein
MRCFTHREIEAVAVCRGCGRGTCSECLTDVGGVIACRGRCEGRVAALEQVLAGDGAARLRGRETYRLAAQQQRMRAIVFLVLLAGVAAIGVVEPASRLYVAVMAAFLALAAWFAWRTAARYAALADGFRPAAP